MAKKAKDGTGSKIVFGHGETFDLGIILSQRWRMKVVRFARLRPRPSCPAYAQGGALCHARLWYVIVRAADFRLRHLGVHS